MKTLLKFSLFALLTFVVILTAACFIVGDTGVFSWPMTYRFVVVLIVVIVVFLFIMMYFDMEGLS